MESRVNKKYKIELGKSVIYLTREEMIEILIQDRFEDWIYASNTDTLEEALWDGWKGYGEYTNKELKDEIEMQFEQDRIEELLAGSESRKEERRKREEDEKKGIIHKLPFEQ